MKRSTFGSIGAFDESGYAPVQQMLYRGVAAEGGKAIF